MNYRTATILAAADQTAGAGTKVMDINIATPISRIVIRWRVTKGAYAMSTYAHKDITKIELVDGSDVLFSMDGGQCQALCMFDRRVSCMNDGTYMIALPQDSWYGIDFGRFLHDPLLALDPTKFRNPQLKITFNEDVSDTASSANELEVFAECFDEKVISPIGFLMSKEHYSYTIGADGSYEYISLPTDYPLRRMLLQGFYKAKHPDYTLQAAKLDEDNDKRVVFDWDLGKYWVYRKEFDLPVIDPFTGYAHSDGVDIYLTPTNYWATLLVVPFYGSKVAHDLVDAGASGAGAGGYFAMKVWEDLNYLLIRGLAYGYCPNHCFNFPFGDPQDIDDWYDVTRVGNLRLRLEAGDAGGTGTGHVVLQQLRKY